jgi:hypothetical protein
MVHELIDIRMNDGSRHFGSLRETYDWHRLRAHLHGLPGARETEFVTDDITEAWIDFEFRGHHFSLNNQFGEWWFFVDDPLCPDADLRDVLQWCERLLGAGGR